MTALSYSNQQVMSRQLGAYRSQTIETASPAKLITMLYDGGLGAIAAARFSIEANDTEGAHQQLVKAQAIVTELSASLNMEEGGEIAQSLAALYDYCTDALIKANVAKSAVHLRPVEQIITDLRDAWNAMSGQSDT